MPNMKYYLKVDRSLQNKKDKRLALFTYSRNYTMACMGAEVDKPSDRVGAEST